MVLENLTQSSEAVWLERGSELIVFSSTLTYVCFLFVNLSFYVCLAVKGSREEGVDEGQIEKDAKVRSKFSLNKSENWSLFIHKRCLFHQQSLLHNRPYVSKKMLLFVQSSLLTVTPLLTVPDKNVNVGSFCKIKFFYVPCHHVSVNKIQYMQSW